MKYIIPALSLLALSVISNVAKADDLPAFPKECVYDSETTAGGRTTTSKIYMENGKVRTETTMGTYKSVSILDPDQKKMYSVMPAQKMVMVMAIPATGAPVPAAPAGGSVTKVGADTVDGVACTKYSVSANGKTIFMWFDASSHPVKTEAEDKSFSVVYKNFQEGAQDPSLFVPPSDYKVTDMTKGH